MISCLLSGQYTQQCSIGGCLCILFHKTGFARSIPGTLCLRSRDTRKTVQTSCQSLYLNHEQLEEAYIADCLSLMLLSNAYEQFAKAVEEESSLYAIELSFLGDEYPLELLPEIFEHVSPDGIHLTGSNMLMPT